MLKNHFLYSYAGNKRQEAETIINLINFDNIKNIIEPFCGSSAMSFRIWKKYKNDFNYYLNDNDEDLINIYKLLKTETAEHIEEEVNKIKNTVSNKEEWLNLLNEYKETKNIYLFIFFTKYSIMSRFGFYSIKMPKTPFKITDETKNFIEFIKSPNVVISNNDWFNIFDKFKDDDTTIFLFDPPYLVSCNMFYNLGIKDQKLNIYEYFFNNKIESFKSHIYLILEHVWIIKALYFGSKIISTYGKKYEISKKNTEHVIIYNK